MAHELSLEEAYETLGVRADASEREINKAFKVLALQKHPGKLVEIWISKTSNLREGYVRSCMVAYSLVFICIVRILVNFNFEGWDGSSFLVYFFAHKLIFIYIDIWMGAYLFLMYSYVMQLYSCIDSFILTHV